MTANHTGAIETLIDQENWQAAEVAIKEELVKDPENHWLWSQLSDVKYEQRDYSAALQHAEKALEEVSDCPLALWAKAGALDMLGRSQEAFETYDEILRRGSAELETPDQDAEECWEDKDWTRNLLTDCEFRIASCLEDMRDAKGAALRYKTFLGLLDAGNTSLYTREMAQTRLKTLDQNEANFEMSKRLIKSSLTPWQPAVPA